MRSFNPIIRCVDGFEMSVQAHDGSYCQRNTDGKLITVECGFPTTTPKTAETDGDESDSGTDIFLSEKDDNSELSALSDFE